MTGDALQPVSQLPNAYSQPWANRLTTLVPASAHCDHYRSVRVERGDNPWLTALHHILPFLGKRRTEPRTVDESFIWRDFAEHPPSLVPA